MIKKHQIAILKYATFEFLSTIFTLGAPFLEASNTYRVPVRKIRESNTEKRRQYLEKIRYLRKVGVIEGFVENKEEYLELTDLGQKRFEQAKIYWENIQIERPPLWDGKWRLVFFDIPEKLRTSRDCLRRKLYNLGFVQVQKSIYIYPFECTQEIAELSRQLFVSKHVLITISEIIQGETKLINTFLELGTLTNQDLELKRIAE